MEGVYELRDGCYMVQKRQHLHCNAGLYGMFSLNLRSTSHPCCGTSIVFSEPNSTRLSARLSPPQVRALKLDFYCCICIVPPHPPSAITPFSCKFMNCILQNPFHMGIAQ